MSDRTIVIEAPAPVRTITVVDEAGELQATVTAGDRTVTVHDGAGVPLSDLLAVGDERWLPIGYTPPAADWDDITNIPTDLVYEAALDTEATARANADAAEATARTAAIAAAIAALVNGAPSQLDTIRELADALGDDANVIATLTANIGTKASSTALAAEATARAAADTTLQTNITAEATARAAADVTLQANIDAEAVARAAAIAAIPAPSWGALTGKPTTFDGAGLAGGSLTAAVTQLALAYTSPTVQPANFNTSLTWTPSAASSQTAIGVASTVLIDGGFGGASAGCYGFYSTCAAASTLTATISFLNGLRGIAQKQNATGNATNVIGVNAWADTRGGTTTNLAGLSSLHSVQTGGTATHAAGLWIQRPTVTSVSTATNLYGIKIDDISGQAGTVGAYYAIRQLGVAPSVFDGAITAASFSGSGAALTALAWAALTGVPTTLLKDIAPTASDTFPGSVGTALNTVTVGGQAYVMWSGAWVVDGSNRAKENASVRNAAVVFDSGVVDQDITVPLANSAPTTGQPGVIVRGVDANNYLVAMWTNGTLGIYKFDAGVRSAALASIAAIAVLNIVYQMRVTSYGNVITVSINGPVNTSGASVSYTLAGAEQAKYVGQFVGLYVNATTGTNAGLLFSGLTLRPYLNTTSTLDARYLRLDAIGQTIAPNAAAGQLTIALFIGTQANQCALKVWGQLLLGNNNDVLTNSTSSGFLHVGSGGGASSGVTLGDKNNTVYAKAASAAFTLPTAALVQTTGGAPATATSTGVAGQHGWDGTNLYICVAANTWKRVAVATF